MPIFSRFLSKGISLCGGFMVYSLEPSSKWNHNWDRRDPNSLVRPSRGPHDDKRYKHEIKKLKPKATRHIFLIRHGQFDTTGKTDVERKLTRLGQEQAMLTGQRLKDLTYNFSKITVSTLTRAKETAIFIQKYLPQILICCNSPSLVEGIPVAPIPRTDGKRRESEVNEFYEDGVRIDAAFQKYFYRANVSQKADSYELIVCHSNIIRYFVCRALQLPREAWLRMTLHHGSITWLTIMSDGQVKLRTFGDCGHMPLNAITF